LIRAEGNSHTAARGLCADMAARVGRERRARGGTHEQGAGAAEQGCESHSDGPGPVWPVRDGTIDVDT
jgi:hypothetical protein